MEQLQCLSSAHCSMNSLPFGGGGAAAGQLLCAASGKSTTCLAPLEIEECGDETMRQQDMRRRRTGRGECVLRRRRWLRTTPLESAATSSSILLCVQFAHTGQPADSNRDETKLKGRRLRATVCRHRRESNCSGSRRATLRRPPASVSQ